MDWFRMFKNRICNKRADVRLGREMYHWGLNADKKEGREKSFKIHTDMKKQRSYAEKSRIWDREYERLLDSGKYDERHMLLVNNPYSQAPLTAMVLFVTKTPCRVRVILEDGDFYTYTSPSETKHRVPVYGLHAGAKNDITVELLDDEDNVTCSTKLVLYTKKLHEMLTDMIEVRKHKKDSAMPWIFVYGGDTKYPYVFDETGEIRYYLTRTPKAYGLFPLSGGRFLFLIQNVAAPSFANPHSVLCQEMDFYGRVIREYLVPHGVHHDGCEMTPGGNLLFASSCDNEYVEDTVVELDRETGEIVKSLCLADVLDKHPYFDFFDWAHLNTVSYREDNHSVLVCMRNLHTVMEIDWETDEIHWLLSDPTVWEGTPYEDKVLMPVGNVAWFYQAHAAYWLQDQPAQGPRQLIIYDNHWHKRRPMKSFDNDKKSYVRIYEIDEAAGTVALKKSYQNTKSRIRSNGIVKDGRLFSMSGYLDKPTDDHDGIITEFNKKTAKVVNKYMTYNSFYRAYPFFADYDELGRPMPEVASEYPGMDLKVWEACEDASVLAGCVQQPKVSFSKGFFKKKKKKRKHVRKEDKVHNYDENEVAQERSAMISKVRVSFYGRVLLMTARDHLVSRVYIKSDDAVYVADYSRTEQRSPALFARARYSLAMPVNLVPDGHYGIYFETDGTIYDTGKSFTIERVEEPVQA